MPLLSMKHISKRFDAVQALQDVSLSMEAGEVLGIVGENGAGKSTLIKVLGGVYQPESGAIALDGQPVEIDTPQMGLKLGVAIIYQELSLVPNLSVAENLFLGHPPRGPLGNMRRGEAHQRSREILQRLHLDVDPRMRVANLRIGVRQLIEVGKALSRSHRARVLVMDEPTSSLNESEISHLHHVVRDLKADGVGVIYISHHLEEVFDICDRVMVMRDGQVVDTRPTAEWTSDEMIEAMVNRSIDEFYPKVDVALGEKVLDVSHLQLSGWLHDVSLTVRAGEVVGLAGLPGCGAFELGQIVGGVRRANGGVMRWQEKVYAPRSPTAAIQAGIGYVPGDRKKEGVLVDFSVRENVTLSVLSQLARWGIVDRKRRQESALQAIESYRIKAESPSVPVKSLSGGNQQKVLLSRVELPQPKLLIMNDPTRGIDVGAKVEIYERIGEFVQQGGAVLLISAELSELIGISDRIVVLRNGTIKAELPREECTQQLILSYAAGANGGETE